MRAERRGLARDARGSATTEGVIVAIFMAIVFGASIWVARLFVGSLAVGREVRTQIDGPSFAGGTEGAVDAARVGLMSPARGLADRWVPLRAREIDSTRIDRVVGTRSTTVERTGPLGGGTEELRWQDSRQRNEVPRAGPEGNWPAMVDTWCRTGMCEL